MKIVQQGPKGFICKFELIVYCNLYDEKTWHASDVGTTS
jgi:hypothetical protein